MVQIEPKISRKLANMSFLCALLVLIIHCPDASAGNNGILKVAFKWVIPGAAKCIANSFFFCAAGFLLGGHILENGWYWREVGKRIKSLLVPYVVLNLLWFGCMALYQHGQIRFGEAAPHPLCWYDVLIALGLGSFANPIIGPLWFVRNLLLLVLTIPLFAFIIRRSRVYAFSLCAGVCAACMWCGLTSTGGDWLFVYKPFALLYFLLGISLRLYGLPIIKREYALVLLAVALGIKATINLTYDMDNTTLQGLTWILDFLARPAIMLGVWTLIPDDLWPKLLTGNAFSIYALHGPFVHMSFIIAGKFGCHDAFFGNFFCSAIFVVLLLIVTIGIATIARRNAWSAQLLLGGR